MEQESEEIEVLEGSRLSELDETSDGFPVTGNRFRTVPSASALFPTLICLENNTAVPRNTSTPLPSSQLSKVDETVIMSGDKRVVGKLKNLVCSISNDIGFCFIANENVVQGMEKSDNDNVYWGVLFHAVYHEDCEKNTFGKIVKGRYEPASDFRFDVVCKVLCADSKQTGFLIKVYPEIVEESAVETMYVD